MSDRLAVRLSVRILELFMHAYPAEFRAVMARDLLDTYRDRCREVWKDEGKRGLILYAVRAALHLIRDGTLERFSTRRTRSRTRRGHIMSSLIQDIRYAIRGIVKNPVFSAVVILTLALGIGVNAAIFSVVNGVLLRPLPYQDPDRLVRVWAANIETGQQFLEASYADFVAFREQNHSFTGMAAFSEAPRDLNDDFGSPSRVTIARISDGWFSLLGVRPVLGRDLLAAEFSTAERVIILSYGFWERRYGGDPNILGRNLTIDNEIHTVVGVAPITYSYPLSADLWRPLDTANQDDDRELHIIARLAPEATVEQATQDVRVIAARLEEANSETSENITPWVQPMHAMLVREVQTPLLILLGAVAAVLLIACANIANLLLARGTARQQEVAVRTALGAGRARIARQFLTESVVLAAAGGAAGLLLGEWALGTIVAVSPHDTPRLNEVSLDSRVVAVMVVVTAIAGIAFGLIPALHSSTPNIQESLKSSGQAATTGPVKQRTQRSLVVAEVALSTVLVVSAGLLIASFTRQIRVERGFDAQGVLVVPIHASERFHSSEQWVSFFDDIVDRIGALPGVQSTGMVSHSPMEPRGFRFATEIDGRPKPTNTERPPTTSRIASRDYFRTIGIPLIAGRVFTDQDRSSAPGVAVVSEAFVRNFFADVSTDPLGYRVTTPFSSYEIVGVVGDVTPDIAAPPAPMMYLPFQQIPLPGGVLMVRTAADPLDLVSLIREQVWAVDPNIPLDDIASMQQVLSETVASPQFTMLLVGLFAALALLLAAVGIYGVTSYAVGRRTKEIGLRQALGAGQANILRMVVRHGLKVTLVGVAIGLVGASWATRLLSTLLYDVSATDPFIYAAVGLFLALVATAASLLPARRATRVDPVVALRSE